MPVLVVHPTAFAGVEIESTQQCNWQCLANIETRQWSWVGPNGTGSVGGCNDGAVCIPENGGTPPTGPCTERDYRTPVRGSCQPTLATYQTQCEASGVPSPPPLGAPPWTNLGTGTGLIVNADEKNPNGTLYSWSPPNGGTCIALQRDSQTGIICSNGNGTHACFYNFAGKNPIGAAIVTYQNPVVNQTMENCTSCHRGPGPILATEPVAHLLDTVQIPKPPTPYVPVGAPPSWIVTGSKDNLCKDCHGMPEPEARWCLNVAIPAISTSYMPPAPKTEQQLQEAASLMLLCCDTIKKARGKLPPECMEMAAPTPTVILPEGNKNVFDQQTTATPTPFVLIDFPNKNVFDQRTR